ncbi:uncharacterized protein LOC126818822 [Patella vulgata]|uniref:uncharacterized protein LOC126818822 n=1 Tax=Patella vulgata TaxID=6465 RepID=UPI00217F6B91|nr:uncharacterized protein LOC126818822 [Patella vulgata]
MYSMTPIMLTMLNLPRHIRNAFGNIMLCGIIPGQNKSEACNLDPYLEILVDEMLYLCKCRAFSEYHKASVDVKLKLLLYVLDYPGLSKLFHIHGSGGLCGCHWCHVRGFHSAGLDKVIYLSNRSFLDKDDPLRLCVDKFYDKFEDRSSKLPARKAHEERDYRVAYKQSKNKAQANSVSTATGCKGPYPLSLLPGHNRIEESLPDACHTIKDFIQNIVYLITGKKKVNVKKVMEAEAASGREKLRVDLSATIVTGKRKRSEISTNQANEATGLQAYSHLCLLTDQEIVLGNERAAKLRVPSGFGLKPGNFLTNTRCLKSHDCKQIATQNILKYCLRGTLGIRERTTLFFLLDCLRDICAESDADDELDELEVKVNKALALFKRDFPVHLQNITTHFIHHIVPDIKKYGPIYSTWMYVFERFNSWICKRALNMQYPEVSAIETYILFEWCNCMISSGKLPATAILTDHLGSYEEESLETKQETRESEKCNVKNSVIY